MPRKNLVIVLVIAVLAVLAVILIWNKYGNKTTAPTNTQQTPPSSSEPTTPAVPATSTPAQKPSGTIKPIGGTSPSVTLSYTKALGIYRKSGYYYQFFKCKGTPGSLTVKKGKQFMLDNRDPKAHTLAFGRQSYYVRGYNFVVATAGYVGKFFITCDGGGAAQILVQP